MQGSCLMEGRVSHARTKCSSSSIAHSFAYPVWMAYIDLDQVDSAENSWFCSLNPSAKFGLMQFRREDYYGAPNSRLSDEIKLLVAQHYPGLQIARVCLLTNLSVLGLYNFNPVSIYYCFGKGDDDAKLQACVLEVSNTPWLAKRLYVLNMAQQQDTVAWEKDFHVSPFMDQLHTYKWKLESPSTQHGIHIEAISKQRDSGELRPVTGPAPITLADSQTIAQQPTSFVVKLDLRPVPLGAAWRVILKNPIMPIAAVLCIHIHAALVWFKGVPYVDAPLDNARELGGKDLLKHLALFAIAIGARYGLPALVAWKLLRGVYTQLHNVPL